MKKPIGNYVELLSGFAFKSNLFNSDGKGMPLIRIRDIKRGTTDTFYDGEYSESYIVKKGDFLIGMDGEFNIYEWKGENALLNQRVCKFNKFSEKIHPRYVFYLVNKELKRIEDNTDAVTVKHISLKQIRDIEIEIPPIEIQKQIVSILEKAEKLKEKRENSNQDTETMIQSIFYEMFGDPIKNEKNWNLKRLDELGIWQSGGTPARGKREYFTGEIPWYTARELNQLYTIESIEKITTEAINNSSAKIIPKNTLLLGMYDTAAFKSSITTSECSCNQAISYSSLENNNSNILYVYYVLQFTKEFHLRLRRGARQKNLNLSMIRETKIPLPPIELQNEFEKRVNLIQSIKNKQKTSTEEINTLFDALMQKAFRGELV